MFQSGLGETPSSTLVFLPYPTQLAFRHHSHSKVLPRPTWQSWLKTHNTPVHLDHKTPLDKLKKMFILLLVQYSDRKFHSCFNALLV